MSNQPEYAETRAGFWCLSCGEQGLPTMREGEVCRLCGEESREPFRVGWDESD